MTPKIMKQTKVLLKTDSNEPANFTRLQANSIIPNVGTELEDWTDEDQPAGWEELDDENTKNLIREKRREQRAQRHQKFKSTRQHSSITDKLGTKRS